ncbi:MAG TPA: hypothetical protein VE842_13480 [Pyrinomonadaceae bacterium]|jgi:uncharacterized membrane protein YgcG|nr:hypothetical protein [Pyrinomonadaceae bacterium]
MAANEESSVSVGRAAMFGALLGAMAGAMTAMLTARRRREEAGPRPVVPRQGLNAFAVESMASASAGGGMSGDETAGGGLSGGGSAGGGLSGGGDAFA